MERWRAGHGNELIEKYGILDDSDPDQDAEAEDPPRPWTRKSTHNSIDGVHYAHPKSSKPIRNRNVISDRTSP